MDPLVRRVWAYAAVAAVLAAAANLIVRSVAVAVYDIPAEFRPLGVTQPVLFTIAGALLAGGVLAGIIRYAKNPRRTFLTVSLSALLLSFAPDIALLQDAERLPGTTAEAAIALMVMHLVAAAIIVPLLLVPLREARDEARATASA